MDVIAFLKMGRTRPLFGIFSFFSLQTLQFLQQYDVKNADPLHIAGIWTHNLWHASFLP